MYLAHFQTLLNSQVFFFKSNGGQLSCVGVLPLDHTGMGDIVGLQLLVKICAVIPE